MSLPVLEFGPLIAAFIVVASVLMVLCLTARLNWRLKAGLLLLGAAAQVGSFYALPPLLGWPATERMPGRFSLLAVHIQEPSQFIETEGEVYFWLVDLDGDTALARPRAHTLPYTPRLKAVAAEAEGKLRKNIPIRGEMLGEGEELGMSGAPADDDEGEFGRLRSHDMDLRFTEARGGGPPAKSAARAGGL